MDDFRLKVFIAAARTLSFTRAAEQLYISQPAVSKHVGELFERHIAVVDTAHLVDAVDQFHEIDGVARPLQG